ncbi:hypothetical protein O9929_22980 [Vibrio lentus]|nr:hypothetical protein [Vibrio lentus]
MGRPRQNSLAPPPAPSPLPEATLSTTFDCSASEPSLLSESLLVLLRQKLKLLLYYQHHLIVFNAWFTLARRVGIFRSTRRYCRRNRVLLILLILLLGGRTRVVRVRLALPRH